MTEDRAPRDTPRTLGAQEEEGSRGREGGQAASA